MPKTKALGTTLSYLPTYDSVAAVKLIGALTSVGEIAPTSDEIDVTTLDSVAKEFIQGARDSGEVPIAGFHVLEDAGQVQMRTLFTSGDVGYFWATFPDNTYVIFSAIVKGHKVGAADTSGAVGFGASLRVTGPVQIIAPKLPVAKAATVGAVTGTMDSTATAKGAPAYQWYSSATNTNVGGTIIGGAISATFAIPADMDAGVHYFYCVVTVAGYRPVPSAVHVVTAT